MGSHLHQVQHSFFLQPFPTTKNAHTPLCQAAPVLHVAHPEQHDFEKPMESPSPQSTEHAVTGPRCEFPGQHTGCQIPSPSTRSCF